MSVTQAQVAWMQAEIARLRAENDALVQRMGYAARQNQALIEECDLLRAENAKLRKAQ